MRAVGDFGRVVAEQGRCAYFQRVPDDIELERSDYADRDPKSGKWRRPLSKKAARNWTVFCVACLTFIFFRVNELTPDISFGLGVLFAAGAGVFAQQWLRDVY